MLSELKNLIEIRNEGFVKNQRFFSSLQEEECLKRMKQSYKRRGAELVRSQVHGRILSKKKWDHQTEVGYILHYEQLIKMDQHFYVQERMETRKALFEKKHLVEDVLNPPIVKNAAEQNGTKEISNERVSGASYNRLEAVRYAELWWDDYNPHYHKFTDNCTNFISQCLKAGNAPMRGFPNRSKGWWYQNNNWSYSWSVAHSMRWYLSGSTSGLRGEERESASELIPGDVICYDFDGDGRWQHTTIVVAKDANGEPLVNAQTTNSRMRYWTYEDSTAWTPDIKYKFFHIVTN
ncbi:amidase domain-containing protein [Alkalihalobacillus trypoxylicola]|uniref:Putative amidase domain-containing protein n=1 Tax=Alkalihalobacillus trypoxylicola TaxID=519424 RepID=A0A161PCF6_9BACI|nr:amidase domain-containing protein [Alkalihalobacillus trypoxylicola]KYG30367.1 hypothetical protein AZF04_19980 [Alkalihalobacillus trypoxylicola]